MSTFGERPNAQRPAGFHIDSLGMLQMPDRTMQAAKCDSYLVSYCKVEQRNWADLAIRARSDRRG